MSYKILIVDDEVTQFNRYKEVLDAYKELRLTHVTNGPDAIIEIQKNPPDLIFLDQVFNAENVEIKKLYGGDIPGNIGEHEEGTNPEDIKNDELKQGLYILKMVRNLKINTERKIPIIFVTQYVDTTGNAWSEAQKNGAQNYISKDRITREMLIPLIERYLCIKLITTDEAINNLLDIYIKGNPKDEKETFVKCLSNEAIKHRRRGIPFVEAILKKLPQSAPTLSDLSETIKGVNEEEIWKSEPVNPQEILRWALAKVTYDELPKDEKAWNYIGHNALRYTFKTAKNGKHYLLKIIHPKYSKEAVSIKSENKYRGIFPVLFCSSFKLEKNDPDWEGTDVVVYLEEMENAKMLREYYEDANTIGSLEADKIQKVIAGLADILKNIPDGHGMIELDSIYIVNNNYVRVADLTLWDSVDGKGHHMIEGLTLVDRRKRDIQKLGVVGDFLISGTPGGIYLPDTPNFFLQFIVDCKNGTWDINNGKIPEPLFNTRFFSNGQFVNISTERKFAYFLKKNLLEKNSKALVYFNTNVLLQKPIANEVDALVVRPGEIFWLDMKGSIFVTDKDYRSVQVTKIKQKTDLLKDLVGKMDLKPDCIIAYCILEDPLFERVKSDLSNAERAVTRSYKDVINEINNAKESVYNLDSFITKFRNAIYSKYQSPYEKMHSFTEHYGNVVEKNGGLFTELYSTEKPYYVRRYSLNCVSDNILDSDYYVSLIEQSTQERDLIALLSSEYILFPQQILLIDSQNEMTTPFVEKTFSDGIVSNIRNPDIRWIYKVYKKPDKDLGCPLQLKDYLNEITEDKKVKLLCHYLKASEALLNSKCNFHFDRDSLKIYKNTKENEYVGVIEPIFTGNIRKEDILIIIDMLNDGKDTFISLCNKVSKAKDANLVLGELIKTLTELIHHKEKYEDKKKELSIDFLINTQLNSTQKPTFSTQKTTQVGKFQNHQEKKVEAESISIKPPEKQTQGRLEGTIKLLAFSVDFNSVNEEKRREQFRCDFINNIKNGQLVKIGYPKQSSGVYSGMIWILNEQQHNTAKDVQVVTIASEPIMEYGSIVFQGKGYMFRKDAISPEDLKGLHEGGTVSFILNKGDIVKDIKIIPS